MSKGLEISYKTDSLNNRLLIEVQKPNKGDEYFMYELMSKVTTGIAEEVTKLGLEKLKKGDKSND